MTTSSSSPCSCRLAGRTPQAALDAFVRPLQRALSCVTHGVLLHSGHQPDKVHSLTLSSDRAGLTTLDSPGTLFLSLAQQYRLVHAQGDLGPWKVRTEAYRYRVDDSARRELISWHWHPIGESRHTRPHLHVSEGRLAGLHLPTGRVSIEAVLRLLLTEFHVRPTRLRHQDWPQVLELTEEAFRTHRTWG